MIMMIMIMMIMMMMMIMMILICAVVGAEEDGGCYAKIAATLLL